MKELTKRRMKFLNEHVLEIIELLGRVKVNIDISLPDFWDYDIEKKLEYIFSTLRDRPYSLKMGREFKQILCDHWDELYYEEESND